MKHDIVFFTLFRTDNAYSSISLSMAKELAKTHRVFYVQHPYTWKDIAAGLFRGGHALRARLPHLLTGRTRYERLASIPENFTAVQPPPVLPVNWLPKGRVYNFFQRFNNGIVLRAIRKVIRDFDVSQFIYINCYDPFFAGVLPKKAGAALCIYHCIDDISQDPYTARHGVEIEHDVIRRADLTFVTSSHLKKLKTPYSDRIVNYNNAADVAHFQKVISEKYPRPAELEGRTGKVIGYIGNLDQLRIDYPLLKKTAQKHPDKTMLLVGPVNSKEPYAIGLDILPNVVFTGSRPLDELPPLLQHMDCVLIPFRCNTLTKSIYPLKINEYLAAGKPVVSTSFSEDICSFSGLIYLAENQEEFIDMVGKAVAENEPALMQRRVETARLNSWEARIRQLWEIVDARTGQSAHPYNRTSTAR